MPNMCEPPSPICTQIFLISFQEFIFWGLEEQEIEACCWADYSKYTEHKDTLKDLDDNFMVSELEGWGDESSKWTKFANTIWEFLEEPTSSRWAKVSLI